MLNSPDFTNHFSNVKEAEAYISMLKDAADGRDFSSVEDFSQFINSIASNINNIPPVDFFGLDPLVMLDFLENDFSELNQYVELDLSAISDDTILMIPIMMKLLYLVSLYEEHDGRLPLTNTGSFKTTVVKQFQTFLNNGQFPSESVREYLVPELNLLHSFLRERNYLKERSTYSELKDPSWWQDLTNKTGPLYKDLFFFTVDYFNWLDLMGDPSLVYSEFALIQDSAVFSLYLLKLKAQTPITSGWLFSYYCDAFPFFSPAFQENWKIDAESEEPAEPEKSDGDWEVDQSDEEIFLELIAYQKMFLAHFAEDFGFVDSVFPEEENRTDYFRLALEITYVATPFYEAVIKWKIPLDTEAAHPHPC